MGASSVSEGPGLCHQADGSEASTATVTLLSLSFSFSFPFSFSLPITRSKELVVTYFFCGEEIPYRSVMKTHCLTLGHFKDQLSKKGNYR